MALYQRRHAGGNGKEEIAEGVNASERRERDSGINGFSEALGHTQPQPIGKTTSGGGTVQFQDGGADMNPGTTAGDLAQLLGMKSVVRYSNRWTTRVFIQETGGGVSDYYAVGMVGDAQVSSGAGWRLDTGDVIIDGNTYATHAFPAYDSVLVEIVADAKESITEIRAWGNNSGFLWEERMDTTPSNRSILVAGESTGNGDRVIAHYARQVMEA